MNENKLKQYLFYLIFLLFCPQISTVIMTLYGAPEAQVK